jgi:hypothetical protein
MSRSNKNASAALIDRMLGEASWLLSHAQALTDYGRQEEAAAEWARAATCEEQVACLLEFAEQELEAAIHRVSAASCYEKLGQYTRAVTLLHAALAIPLQADFRARVEQERIRCLGGAQKEAKRAGKRLPSKSSMATSQPD